MPLLSAPAGLAKMTDVPQLGGGAKLMVPALGGNFVLEDIKFDASPQSKNQLEWVGMAKTLIQKQKFDFLVGDFTSGKVVIE